MKKVWLLVLIFLLGLNLMGCGDTADNKPANNQVAADNSKNEVAAVVKSFGERLQLVSLQGPAKNVAQDMQENYGTLVSPALLKRWQNAPLEAPGRMVSSPWPDRIEIKSVKKITSDSYLVEGEIIEITSVEKISGGAAATRPINLTVKKIGGKWLIDEVTLGDYESSATIKYQNVIYGFNLSLPRSWSGYSVIDDKWEGYSAANPQKTIESGPMVSIRHPKWTAQNPRQDIPIMILTVNQWQMLQEDKFHIGASPIKPKELGRNTQYVFALPARYNYAFPAGYEEVEEILNSGALEAFN